jgi:hypothetical protein
LSVSYGICLGQHLPTDRLQEHDIPSDREQFINQLRPANQINSADAARSRKGDNSSANNRVCRILNDPITGIQGNVFAERQRSRRRIDPKHRKLLNVRIQ